MDVDQLGMHAPILPFHTLNQSGIPRAPARARPNQVGTRLVERVEGLGVAGLDAAPLRAD